MLRVYLDQCHWIALAKAHHGRPDGDPFREALDLARHSVEQRLTSFPLSATHYLETWKRGDPRSRQRLGRTMWELSRSDTMAAPIDLLPAELDAALYARFGRPEFPRVAEVFGPGAAHAFASEDFVYRLPGDLRDALDDGDAASLELEIGHHLEKAMMTGPDFALPRHGIARPDESVAVRHATEEQERMRRLEDWGWSEDRARRFVLASAYLDILDDLNAALHRARLPAGVLLDGGEASMTEFLNDLPVAWTINQLREIAYKNRHYRWKKGDLNDVSALATAAVHCDVVIGERHWISMLRRVDTAHPGPPPR